MRVEKKYLRTRVVHRTLLQDADDVSNNELSCGFLYKGFRCGSKKNIMFSNYGGLYVISGSGVYVDAESGMEYPIYPGCIVQRMPGVLHHHVYTSKTEPWLEFFFCAGEKIFSMLSSLKLVSDAPVFYLGESSEVLLRLVEYLELFEKTDDRYASSLVIEFQRLLCYLNRRREVGEGVRSLDPIIRLLHQDYRVGSSVRDLIDGCGIGYEAFRKRFRAEYGCSPEQYRIQLRINAAKDMLMNRIPIQEIANRLGYCDTYSFCKQFKSKVGVSPGSFPDGRAKADVAACTEEKCSDVAER